MMLDQTSDPTHDCLSPRTSVRLKSFLQEETGQDLIEYALAAALIALAAIATMKNLGSTVAGAFTRINTTFSSQL